MNRIDVLEAMYEVLEDSTEWAIGSKDDSYAYFVDGILAMTDVMLNKIKIIEPLDNIKDVQHILEVEPVYINGEPKV